MRRTFLLLFTMTLMVLCASAAGAWQVTIKNECPYNLNVDVVEWRFPAHKYSGNIDVPAGATRTYPLQPWSCAFGASGDYFAGSWGKSTGYASCFYWPQVPCCWNVYYTARKYGNDCRLYRFGD